MAIGPVNIRDKFAVDLAVELAMAGHGISPRHRGAIKKKALEAIPTRLLLRDRYACLTNRDKT